MIGCTDAQRRAGPPPPRWNGHRRRTGQQAVGVRFQALSPKP